MTSTRFLARMSLETQVGMACSEVRIRLLEEIDRRGSINQAARQVPLSYKAAWDAVEALNSVAPEPVVVRAGTGSQLSHYGRRLVCVYRTLEAEYQRALDGLSRRLHEGNLETVLSFRQALHRLTLKTSARNQFLGRVVGLQPDGFYCVVRVQLDEVQHIVATITATSVKSLGLNVGKEVFVMIKSSSVMLTPDRSVRLSVPNQLLGHVCGFCEGSVHDEVVVALTSGRTLACLMERGTCAVLGIELNSPVRAFFKSSSVMVAVYEQ